MIVPLRHKDGFISFQRTLKSRAFSGSSIFSFHPLLSKYPNIFTEMCQFSLHRNRKIFKIKCQEERIVKFLAYEFLSLDTCRHTLLWLLWLCRQTYAHAKGSESSPIKRLERTMVVTFSCYLTDLFKFLTFESPPQSYTTDQYIYGPFHVRH